MSELGVVVAYIVWGFISCIGVLVAMDWSDGHKKALVYM
jgi:hypothetical protein